MALQFLESYDLILASASPRRKLLMEEMGLPFVVVPKDVDEGLLEPMTAGEAAVYLCELKANAFHASDMNDKSLVIAADTVVSINGQILGKPTNEAEATQMLTQLSGRKHEVITGVCLRSLHKSHSFTVSTWVYFKQLQAEEIQYYIHNFKPYDKAGAYGIQEWIGHVAIEKIEGSYFNVMGLPTHRLYEELIKF